MTQGGQRAAQVVAAAQLVGQLPPQRGQAIDVGPELLFIGGGLQQPVGRRDRVLVVALGAQQPVADDLPGFGPVLLPRIVDFRGQDVREVVRAVRAFLQRVQQQPFRLGHFGRLVAVQLHDAPRGVQGRRVQREQRLVSRQSLRLVVGIFVGPGDIRLTFIAVLPLRVLLLVPLDRLLDLGRGRAEFVQEHDQQAQAFVGLVDRQRLAEALHRVGVLAQRPVVAGHPVMHGEQQPLVGDAAFGQHFGRQRVRLRRLVGTVKHDERAVADLAHQRAGRELVDHGAGDVGRQLRGLVRAERLADRDRPGSGLPSDGRVRLPLPDGLPGRGRAEPLGRPFHGAGQPHLDRRSFGFVRIAFQELAAGGDQLLVAGERFQGVEQLEHHRLVPLVRGMDGDELLGRADQAEDPAVGVVQVDQLGQDLRRFGRGVLVADQVDLQPCRFLVGRAGRRLLGRQRCAPFSLAANLRGIEPLLLDMHGDPEFARGLMDAVVEGGAGPVDSLPEAALPGIERGSAGRMPPPPCPSSTCRSCGAGSSPPFSGSAKSAARRCSWRTGPGNDISRTRSGCST